MAYLNIAGEKKQSLNSKLEWTIGRSPSADIQLTGGEVSRQHARIYWHKTQLLILDTGSRNGTFLNGKQVTSKPVPLNNDDVITIGDIVLRVGLNREEVPHDTYPRNEDSTNICHTKMLTTILVVDIRNYCQLTREMSDEVLAPIIADWCYFVGTTATRHGAFCHKAIGDQVMVVWTHTDNILKDLNNLLTTLNSVTLYVKDLCRKYNFKPSQFNFGAGINTGYSMVGNNGSGTMQDFTPLGDVVNAAARYEDATKTIGCHILLGSSTYSYLKFSQPLTQHQIQLKGYDSPHILYSLSREQLQEYVLANNEADSCQS